jgi:hypothetical protein
MTSTIIKPHSWINVAEIVADEHEERAAEVLGLLDAIEPISRALQLTYYRFANSYCATATVDIHDVTLTIEECAGEDREEAREAADGIHHVVDALSGYTAIARRFRDVSDELDVAADEAGASTDNAREREAELAEMAVNLPDDPRAPCHALAKLAEQVAALAEFLVAEAGPIMGKLEAQRISDGIDMNSAEIDERQRADGTGHIFDALVRIEHAGGAYNDPALLGIGYERACMEQSEPEHREAHQREIERLEALGVGH